MDRESKLGYIKDKRKSGGESNKTQWKQESTHQFSIYLYIYTHTYIIYHFFFKFAASFDPNT